jgi:hypothetical protein
MNIGLKDKLEEIYQTTRYPSTYPNELDKKVEFITNNLEEIREICDEKKLNNIIERIRIISSMETGRFQELYPELSQKITKMTTEEFIKYIDSYVFDERRLYRFSEFSEAQIVSN